MFSYIRIVALCTFAGYLLAIVFMTEGGSGIGAAKGLLVGIMVAWGEWKSKQRRKPIDLRSSNVVVATVRADDY